jgi:hypothetical protein
MRDKIAMMMKDIYPNLETNEDVVTAESRIAPKCM